MVDNNSNHTIVKLGRRLLIACAMCIGFGAQAQIFESKEQQVPLIELFTSEGCSSCPPADRWLAKFSDREGLWQDFVPLAFHVDYWDHIGWQDPFASKEYSQRQRRYAQEYKESTVYTPGVRKGGEEWRRWYLSGVPQETSNTIVGRIRLEIDASGRFVASFPTKSRTTQLNVALLGLGLSTEVKRGENRGKTLQHDFVVLGLTRMVSIELGKWQGKLPAPRHEAPRYAVAAWISEGGSQTPIQATGGFLPTFERIGS